MCKISTFDDHFRRVGQFLTLFFDFGPRFDPRSAQKGSDFENGYKSMTPSHFSCENVTMCKFLVFDTNF